MNSTRRSVLRASCGLFAFGSLAGCVGDPSSSGSGTETGTRSSSESTSPENTALDTDTEQPTTTEHETDVPTTTPPETEPRNVATDGTPTSGTTSGNRGCNGARDLLFKPHKRNGAIVWNRRSVQVGGFSLGPNANVLLVVYEDDTVLGTAEWRTPEDAGVVVDGTAIPLKKPLTGEHTIRVVMYADPEGDGTFDAESATPCRYEGEVIQAGPETLDFSEFAPGTSTTP